MLGARVCCRCIASDTHSCMATPNGSMQKPVCRSADSTLQHSFSSREQGGPAVRSTPPRAILKTHFLTVCKPLSKALRNIATKSSCMPSWSRQPPSRPLFARRAFQARMHVTACSVSNRPCFKTRAGRVGRAHFRFATNKNSNATWRWTTARSPRRRGSGRGGGLTGKPRAQLFRRDQVPADKARAFASFDIFGRSTLSHHGHHQTRCCT